MYKTSQHGSSKGHKLLIFGYDAKPDFNRKITNIDLLRHKT